MIFKKRKGQRGEKKSGSSAKFVFFEGACRNLGTSDGDNVGATVNVRHLLLVEGIIN